MIQRMKICFLFLSFILILIPVETSDTKEVTACEGDIAHLNCNEEQFIHIVKVFYGRRDKVTCATDGSTDNWESGCYSLNALDVVTSKCEFNKDCNVSSNNELYSDPCPGIVKYLEVEYSCANLTSTTTDHPTAFTSQEPPTSTTSATQLTDHTTQTSTTQIQSPTYTTQSQALHICNGTSSHQNGMCLSALQSFILQFNMGEIIELKKIQELEVEILTGDDIRELVGFIANVGERVKEHLESLHPSDRGGAIINIHEGFYHISGFLLSKNKMEVWKELPVDQRKRLSSLVVKVIEDTSFIRAECTGRPFSLKIDHISLEMHVVSKSRIVKELSFHSFSQTRKKSNKITLSGPSIQQQYNKNGVAHVLFVSYSDLHQLFGATLEDANAEGSTPRWGDDSEYSGAIATEIISASINGRSGMFLKDPVKYSLEHLESRNASDVACMYWEFPEGSRSGGWMRDGCRVKGRNATHTRCSCDHLTNFAVLMAVSGHMDHVTDSRHAFVLSFVTYFGCIISIIALLASFLVFTFVRSIQCKRNTIHKNVVICLCISELIFLIGISPTSSKVLCSVIAMCLHYLFLCTFLWMFLEGVQLYVMLVQVFIIKMSRALWYYVFSYGTSAIIVIISASVNFNGYGTPRYCWLSTEGGFIWSFVGPVCFVLMMNMIFLSMAVFVMCKHTYFANAKGMDKDSVTQIGSWVKGLVTLVVLLGLTWIFGILYVSSGTIVMAYIFTFLNAFQGLFIFIFHCLLNEKVRKTFRRNFRDWSPIPNCWSIRSVTSSSSPRASSTINNNVCKKRSCSTSVSPMNPLGSLYKKIHNRKISTSTQARSSVVLISQQRTSISYQHSSDCGISNEASQNHHIYSEPTLEDPSAYLDPTLIRLDPEEEMSWSPGYSHIEGSVADTEYLDDSGPRRNIYTNEPLGSLQNASLVIREEEVSPSSRLDVKKYQLRRNTEGSPSTPYRADLPALQELNNLASYPKLVVLGRERIARLPSLSDRPSI